MRALASVLGLAALAAAAAAPAKDFVASLPTFGAPAQETYSGYLNVTGTAKRLHYMFVKAQSDSANAPVVLWLNGGPGCSSLDGYFYEHGPQHVNSKGELYTNPHSWNKYANMLYLEAPAGVGFSYSTDPADYTTDDFQVADDNYHALQFFFTEKFPELADNDFVVTGESYGGIYVPSLTVRILTGNAAGTGQKINIKGFAVGNGVSSYAFNTNSLIYYVYYHGFIGPELWATLSANCNGNFANPPNAACNNAVNAANDIVYNSGLNFYGWEMECAPGSPEGDLRQALAMETLFHGSSLTPPPVKTLDATSLGEGVPCINSTAGTMYLNRPDVRAALHISPLAHDWAICFGGLNYNRTILDITPYWSKALAAGMHGSIYNGDTDMACNVLGDEWAVSSLDLPTDGPRSAWHTDGQVAGFFQAYKGGMDFWTVKGSGHMVPQFKPPQAEFMFRTILQRTGVIPSSSSSTQLDDSGAFQDDKEGSPVRLRGLAQE